MSLKPVTRFFILLIGLGLLYPANTTAQITAPEKAMGRYTHYSWQDQHGLPQNSVYAITQTRDGYLWLGTIEGLARFDGVRFEVFDGGDLHGIKIKLVTALLEDREGSLWIATGNFGLIRFRDGKFTAYTSQNGLPSDVVKSVCEDADGGLWVGTAAGLSRFEDGKFVTYTSRDGLAGDHVTALLRDRRGSIWAGTNGNGISKLEGGKFTNYTTGHGLSSDSVVSFYEDQDESIWIGTAGGGLNCFRDGRFTHYAAKEGLVGDHVWAIYNDYEGGLWVGTNVGLNRLKDGVFSVSAGKEGEPVLDVKSIHVDRERNIWVGAQAGGLNLFRDGRFRVLIAKDGLASDLVWAVAEDDEGNLWVLTEGGLNRVKDGRVRAYAAKDGLADDNVIGISPDNEGNLWFITPTGLTRYRRGKFTSFTARDGLSDDRVLTVCAARDGGVWVSTAGGLNRFKDGRFTALPAAENLAPDTFRRCHEDARGDLWLGTMTRGLFRFKDGKYAFQDVMPGPPYDQVVMFYEDRAGTVWIGTGGGLIRFKDEKFMRIRAGDGLYDDLAFQILEDDDGNFWMSCNKGVYRVAAQELNDFADGRIDRVNSYIYGTEDGMLSRECNGGQPAGWRAKDGTLWFPTIKGLAGVASRRQNREPPAVIIEEIFGDGKGFDHLRAARMGPGVGEVEIQYTGLSWDVPQRVRFKYKLEGYDQDWVEAGSRRIAYYTNLAPGDYTFRVIASNNDGVWNETGAKYEFYLRPHFYQTAWFQALALLSLGGIVVLLYRRRVAALRREHLAQQAFSTQLIASQEQERKRIAAELHDSLGQSLAIIKNRALLSLKTPENHERALAQMDEIAVAATHAIDEVKVISYNLRPHQLDRLGLTRAVVTMLDKVAAANGLRLSIDVDQIDGLFAPDSEINLYRIVQESVNNVVKHSGATAASVRVTRHARRVELIVSDNGRGFDPEAAAANDGGSPPEQQPRAAGGFGLIGIAERVRILGGQLAIRSAPGQGTTLTVRFDVKGERDGE